MSIQQSILDQYTAADEDQRIGLYLIHRGMREEFMKIDLSDAAKAASKQKETSVKGSWGHLYRCWLGWMKLGRV